MIPWREPSTQVHSNLWQPILSSQRSYFGEATLRHETKTRICVEHKVFLNALKQHNGMKFIHPVHNQGMNWSQAGIGEQFTRMMNSPTKVQCKWTSSNTISYSFQRAFFLLVCLWCSCWSGRLLGCICRMWVRQIWESGSNTVTLVQKWQRKASLFHV